MPARPRWGSGGGACPLKRTSLTFPAFARGAAAPAISTAVTRCRVTARIAGRPAPYGYKRAAAGRRAITLAGGKGLERRTVLGG